MVNGIMAWNGDSNWTDISPLYLPPALPLLITHLKLKWMNEWMNEWMNKWMKNTTQYYCCYQTVNKNATFYTFDKAWWRLNSTWKGTLLFYNHLNLVCYSRPWPWLVISEITEKKWLKIFLKPTDLTRPHRRQTEAAATKSPTQHPRRRPVSHPFFFRGKKINRCS